jgi:hypothetical protein
MRRWRRILRGGMARHLSRVSIKIVGLSEQAEGGVGNSETQDDDQDSEDLVRFRLVLR